MPIEGISGNIIVMLQHIYKNSALFGNLIVNVKTNSKNKADNFFLVKDNANMCNIKFI